MGGTAKKSTGGRKSLGTRHARKAITAGPSSSGRSQDRNYVIEKMGPIYLKWGKKRYRDVDENQKMVTKINWYIKSHGKFNSPSMVLVI